MPSLLASADDLLRGRAPDDGGAAPAAGLLKLLAVITAFGLFYGAVMGTFGGIQGERALQLLYSGLKVPLLLLVTFALSLPSFFVLNTLLGVRADFGRALRALVATQAVLTIVLASLAPFTALWYASSASYRPAILFNAAMFAVASFAAQGLLRRWYAPMVARSPRHRALLRVWIVIYAFVGVQMAWVLRPFVGDPTQPTRFFRQGAWGNAYVEVARMMMEVVR
jgi:hypothetical protein